MLYFGLDLVSEEGVAYLEQGLSRTRITFSVIALEY